MPTASVSRSAPHADYAPPARADLLQEGLRCVVAGRPLPAALRPTPAPIPTVASVAEGIAWILAGPAERRRAT